jgi:hypothetical protein
MSQVTLDDIEAQHAATTKLILQFKQQASRRTLGIAAAEVTLQPGERYAGAVLDEAGQVKHHLVLLALRTEEDLNWKAAQSWAMNAGGCLPTRQEQALLFANCKDALPQRWCWSCEAEGSSFAWFCFFSYGFQYFYLQSAELCAVAVRRFTP